MEDWDVTPLVIFYDRSSFFDCWPNQWPITLVSNQIKIHKMKSLIIFIVSIFCFANALFSQNITGTWNGMLDIQGMQLRIVFHIEKTPDGYSTTMDSPDQGATGFPADATSFSDRKLTIKASALDMNYSGNLTEDGQKIEGTFMQGSMAIPLELGREEMEKAEVKTRPQDPTDFPYRQEEVKFENSTSEGVTLAGTLTLPEGQNPKSVVVLVSGSGGQNRNEEVQAFNHRPFLVLSDYLTRKGIGVLRYDDRGIAESTGDHSTATSADFATDASAAVDYLANRPDLAGVKIGIAGHSEGGMIAPMVANMNDDVDFIALLAGPGIPIDELLLLQSKLIAAAEGAPMEMVELNQGVLANAYTYMKKEKDASDEEVQKGLVKVFRKGLESFPDEVKNDIGDLDQFANDEAEELLAPWFRYFISFEPSEHLQKVTCPVLAINGELDLQVPAKENLSGIEAALKAGGNTDFEIVEMPGLNHLFQKAETGATSEYAQIDETFNEAAMERIAKWIHQQ